MVRERFKISGQVQGPDRRRPAVGIVLIALPIGLFLLMLHMKPDYIELLWTDPTGHQDARRRHRRCSCSGPYVIKKIVNIKV